MAATRRLQKELGEIRNSTSKAFRDVQVCSIVVDERCQRSSSMIFYQVDESNLLVWQGLLVPDKAPYNKVK